MRHYTSRGTSPNSAPLRQPVEHGAHRAHLRGLLFQEASAGITPPVPAAIRVVARGPDLREKQDDAVRLGPPRETAGLDEAVAELFAALLAAMKDDMRRAPASSASFRNIGHAVAVHAASAPCGEAGL